MKWISELDSAATGEAFWAAFDRTQAVVVRGALTRRTHSSAWWGGVGSAKQLEVVARRWPDVVGASWSVEWTPPDRSAGEPAAKRAKRRAESVTASHILSSATAIAPSDAPYYASFIAQTDADAVAFVTSSLPSPMPPYLATKGALKVVHGAPIWLFFGRNSGATELPGRKEHTDDVTHDGTWHVQLAGSKAWMVRPTDALLQRWRERASSRRARDGGGCSGEDAIPADGGGGGASAQTTPPQRIVLGEGDVFVINTREWWHSTELPPLDAASGGRATEGFTSVSAARDFCIGRKEIAVEGSGAQASSAAAPLTNREGAYAPHDIAEGDVIITADEMPDCELPESTDEAVANCVVATIEIEGRPREAAAAGGAGGDAADDEAMLGLVATRDIQSGEWFVVLTSDASDSGVGSEDEGGAERWAQGRV